MAVDLHSYDLLRFVEPHIQAMKFGTVNSHAESGIEFVGSLFRNMHLRNDERVAITRTRPQNE